MVVLDKTQDSSSGVAVSVVPNTSKRADDTAYGRCEISSYGGFVLFPNKAVLKLDCK